MTTATIDAAQTTTATATAAAPVPMTRAQVLEVVAKAREAGQRAYLRGADLQDAYLRGADLQDADLQDADLQGADLQDAYLRGADLRGADLRGADLRGADLRGAEVGGGAPAGAIFGFAPDPALPLAVARAVLADPDKALKMESWHTCDTTHCLAGWAIHLSGAAGYALQAATSPSVAGLMLAPSLAPYFYGSNATAIQVCRDIVAEAEVEAAPTD